MKKGYKVRGRKFSGKSHSVKAMISFITGIFSIALYVTAIVLSFSNQGNGNMYLGSVGVLAFFIGFFSLLVAMDSFREQNKYRSCSIAALIINILSFIAGIALYVMGI